MASPNQMPVDRSRRSPPSTTAPTATISVGSNRRSLRALWAIDRWSPSSGQHQPRGHVQHHPRAPGDGEGDDRQPHDERVEPDVARQPGTDAGDDPLVPATGERRPSLWPGGGGWRVCHCRVDDPMSRGSRPRGSPRIPGSVRVRVGSGMSRIGGRPRRAHCGPMQTAQDRDVPPSGGPPSGGPPPAPPLSRLTRSTQDKVVSGLCGGLGRHFAIDPIVIRVAFVVLTLAGGTGILLYLVGWALIPDDQGGVIGGGVGDKAPLRWVGEDRSRKLVAAVVAGGGLLILLNQITDGSDGDVALGLCLVGLGAAFLWSRRNAGKLPPGTGPAVGPARPGRRDVGGAAHASLRHDRAAVRHGRTDRRPCPRSVPIRRRPTRRWGRHRRRVTHRLGGGGDRPVDPAGLVAGGVRPVGDDHRADAPGRLAPAAPVPRRASLRSGAARRGPPAEATEATQAAIGAGGRHVQRPRHPGGDPRAGRCLAGDRPGPVGAGRRPGPGRRDMDGPGPLAHPGRTAPVRRPRRGRGPRRPRLRRDREPGLPRRHPRRPPVAVPAGRRAR